MSSYMNKYSAVEKFLSVYGLLLLLIIAPYSKALAQQDADKVIILKASQEVSLLKLTILAETPVETIGIKEPIVADGVARFYSATSSEIQLKGRITSLICSGNGLKAIDISKCNSLVELDCASNAITQLSIKDNKLLQRLNCSDNPIKQIVTSGNRGLLSLNCSNTQIIHLDLSNNARLENLQCSGNSNDTGASLSVLTLTSCAGLKWLDVSHNKLKALDLSGNPNLEYLDCNQNHISELKTEYCPKLEVLNCSDNTGQLLMNKEKNAPNTEGLTSLDLSKNPNLKVLECYSNNLSSLDVSHNPLLETLIVSSTNITSLVLKNNKALKKLSCSNKGLQSIDLTQNEALEEFSCEWGLLKEINLTRNPQLKSVSVGHNQLTQLDLSHNPLLEMLSCYSNAGIKELNLSANTRLRSLVCNGCNLKGLNLSANKELTFLSCYENGISGTAMTALMQSLPQRKSEDKAEIKVINTKEQSTGSEHNSCTREDVAIARGKNWWVINYNGFANKGEGEIYYGSDNSESDEIILLTFNKKNGSTVEFALMRSGEVSATGIGGSLNSSAYASSYRLTSETIQLKGRVEGLEIIAQGLKSIDLSKAGSMRFLNIKDNAVSGSLDLSQCSLLQQIECQNNRIEQISFGQTPRLESANLANNKLSTLTLQADNLMMLDVAKNNIKTLDLSSSSHLKTLYCETNDIETLLLNSRELQTLCCRHNALSAEKSQQVANSLPNRKDLQPGFCVLVDKTDTSDGNDIYKQQVQELQQKNWIVLDLHGNSDRRSGILYEGVTGGDTQAITSENSISCHFIPSENLLCVKGAQPYEPIRLFSLEGSLLLQSNVNERGEAVIALCSLPEGIYIVSGNSWGKQIIKPTK